MDALYLTKKLLRIGTWVLLAITSATPVISFTLRLLLIHNLITNLIVDFTSEEDLINEKNGEDYNKQRIDLERLGRQNG